MSEAELQSAVIDCARLLGWRVAHFRSVKTDTGWRTPVQADGAGFPDLCMCHDEHGVLFAELKTATGRVSSEQTEWLNAIGRAGVRARVWRPADWASGHIEGLLRGG